MSMEDIATYNTDEIPDVQLLPIAPYPATVTNAKVSLSKKGYPMLAVTFKIAYEDYPFGYEGNPEGFSITKWFTQMDGLYLDGPNGEPSKSKPTPARIAELKARTLTPLGIAGDFQLTRRPDLIAPGKEMGYWGLTDSTLESLIGRRVVITIGHGTDQSGNLREEVKAVAQPS